MRRRTRLSESRTNSYRWKPSEKSLRQRPNLESCFHSRARLRRQVRGSRTDIVVLYADIRGFSTWSNATRPNDVAKVVEICYERVHQIHVDFLHSFHKLLGDGFLLVWEIDDFRNDKTNDCHRACGALTCAINAAFEIHKKYFYMKRSLKFSCPKGFGIGIAIGTAYRIRVRTLLSNLDEDDYVGYPMNAGSRLQQLAPPYGTVLDSTASSICRKCPRELLRVGFLGYELELVDPTEKAIQDAAKAKGLNYKDRRFFNFLTYPSARDYLWKSNGVR